MATFFMQNKLTEANESMEKFDSLSGAVERQGALVDEYADKLILAASENMTVTMKRANAIVIAFTVLAVIGGIVMGMFTSRSMSKRIGYLNAFANTLASGDLTVAEMVGSNAKGSDEITELERSLKAMAANFKDILSNTTKSSYNVAISAEKVAVTSNQIAKSAQEEASATDETTSSMEEMAVSISQVAKNAEALASNVDETSTTITEMSASIEQVGKNAEDLRAVPPLIQALKDNSPNVRATSAEALGKIKSPEALAHLEKCLNDDPWVGQAAIDAIGKIGGDGALRIFYHAIENPQCRDMAIEAIGRAGDSNSIRVLTPLIESGQCSETALMAIVRTIERENSKPMPEYFVSLMPMLLRLKDSPRPELRASAMKALCWSEQVSAIPYLVDAIGEEELQEYAIEGLLSIGKKAVPAIIDALKNPDKKGRPILAKILSMLGEHMALARFTNDIDAEVRVEATLALGKMPSERSVRLLSELLSDTEEEVRAAVARAIDSLNKLI